MPKVFQTEPPSRIDTHHTLAAANSTLLPGFLNMRTANKVWDPELPYFITNTLVFWIDLFVYPDFQEILVDSMNFLSKQKKWRIHGYVIMSNHIHLIVTSDQLPKTVQSFKRFTSQAISMRCKELYKPKFKSAIHSFNYAHQLRKGTGKQHVWQLGYHPVELSNVKLFNQKLNYMHDNPVRKGLVREQADYRLSSAADYQGVKGPVILDLLYS